MYQGAEHFEGNLDKLELFLQKYGEITNIYVAAYGGNGQQLTEFSADETEKKSISVLFPEDLKKSVFHRVADNEIEDQAIENHAIHGIKVAATATKRGKTVSRVWLFFAVMESELDMSALSGEEQAALQTLKRRTEFSAFLKSVDILHDIGSEVLRIRNSMIEWESEKKKSAFVNSELSENLHRMKITTQMLQYLDSDKSSEAIIQDFLHLTGEFLDVEMNCMIKVQDNSNRILAKWSRQSENLHLDYELTHQRFPFLEGRKPSIISFDSPFIRRMEDEQMEIPFKAVISIPIELNRQVDMYACFIELENERTWQVEEVQFIKDMIRILQTIMEKRIQKNSIASSYASLEEILENVGCAILVCEPQDGYIHFANQKTTSMFPKGKDSEEFFKEIFHQMQAGGTKEILEQSNKKWYEVYCNQIRWVDGQKKDLYSIYDITEKKAYQKKIEQQAYTDFLTGLYNRLCCERDLARAVDEAKNKHKTGVLLYLDLDDFKHINDGLGHQYGDLLLKDISKSFRQVSGIEETCYRVGGDEFVIIIMPDQFQNYERIVEDIRNIFVQPWLLKEGVYYCTMSMGAVKFSDEGENVTDLICKADIAMYEAKKKGKNRVEEYHNDTAPESGRRLNMEKNMRDAALNGYREFQIYYQPIIDIQKEGHPCVGAEALLRWDSAELGFMSPADFIPLAEYLGLINPIGNYVLEEACKSCRKWNTSGHPEMKINVNLSVVQLLQNDIVEIVEDIIKRTKINPKNLTLEMTENLAVNDMPRMCEIMTRIRKLGVRIALDDFGTGYSSLNYIRELPLDVIKVDRTFVSEIAEDDFSKAFVKMVAELADTIGVNICVEGVETGEQDQELENMKVRLVQGYYFDRPMPKENFEDKYVRKVQEKKNRKRKVTTNK